jgi:hypothetical protein
MTMVFTQPWFEARVASRRAALLDGPPAPHPAERVFAAPVGQLHVRLLASPGADLAVSADGAVALLLHGELHDPPAGAAELLARYRERGLGWAAELDGSFALLIADTRAAELLVVTDRLGSRRVYGGGHDGAYYLASRLAGIPVDADSLDRTALAGYLVNGVVHNGRTPFAGVRALERACIHRVGLEGPVSAPYWRYSFEERAGASPQELRAELAELLVEAVRRRLPADGATYLSLSAGHDAAALLGALGAPLRAPDVRCLSYSLGAERPDDDAVLSRPMAAIYGYDHRTIPSYDGDLLGALARNVARGEGGAHFCEEALFWEMVGPELSAEAGSILVGDHCLGIKDPTPPCSHAEALRKVQIRGYDDLPGLDAFLPAPLVGELRGLWEAELAAIVGRCPAGASLDDCKDFLYLDQRTAHLITPWRERFAGPWAPVRSPLLASPILDFNRQVPADLRRGKALWKTTVEGLFPQIFALPRGNSRYMPPWRDEYARHAPAIAALIEGEPSPLDAYVPPDTLLRLLALNAEAVRRVGGLPDKLQRLAARALGRLRRSLGSPPAARPLDHSALLQRLLVLRAYLRERAARPAQAAS